MNMHVKPRENLRCASMTITDLSLERNGRLILDKARLSIDQGQITAIVGPSGAGKSSLIHVLNGSITPTSGVIHATDLGPLSSPTTWERMRKRTGTIFQGNALIGRLPALDNVLSGLVDTRHPLSLLPWSRVARARAMDALRQVDLLDRAFERTENLSGGEQQRVGIARALARQPRLLFADEPFSALDRPLAMRFCELFAASTRENGRTVVLVTHQLDLARAFADRVIGLRSGRIAFDGPTTLFDKEAERYVFSGNSNL